MFAPIEFGTTNFEERITRRDGAWTILHRDVMTPPDAPVWTASERGPARPSKRSPDGRRAHATTGFCLPMRPRARPGARPPPGALQRARRARVGVAPTARRPRRSSPTTTAISSCACSKAAPRSTPPAEPSAPTPPNTSSSPAASPTDGRSTSSASAPSSSKCAANSRCRAPTATTTASPRPTRPSAPATSTSPRGSRGPRSVTLTGALHPAP